MTIKEKMLLLTGTPERAAESVAAKVTDGAEVKSVKGGPAIPRFDIRKHIKARMKEEGITSYELAAYLGKRGVNISAYLAGRQATPLADIEAMLWLFTPDNYEL